MRLSVRHTTVYEYDEPTRYSVQTLRLTPASNPAQRVTRWRLKAEGKLVEMLDSFGNITHMLVIDKPHRRVVIEAEGEVETSADQSATLPETGVLNPLIYLRETALTESNAAIAAFASQFEAHMRSAPREALFALMAGIRERIAYRTGASSVTSTAADVFSANAGVCQDHSHVFLACARLLGVPARYVSGYLFTENASSEASHAWVEAWLPEQGWLGLDVANNIAVGPMHVRIAVGLDYRSASPVTGVRRGGGAERMDVSVQIAQAQQ